MANVDVGIVGLPNSGKSTVFNALTGGGAQAEKFAFSTREMVQGIAPVTDRRLDELARVSDSGRIVPATVKVLDIPGLVRGASHGEGLGNQFLGSLRTVDAIVHVVRCFCDEEVPHPDGRIAPLSDAETVELELVLADAAAVERRLERVAKTAKSGDRAAVAEAGTLRDLLAWLNEGNPARSFAGEVSEALDLLTTTPTLYLANVDDSGNPEDVAALQELAAERGVECLAVNAKVEAEIAELDAEDRAAFLDDLGIAEAALERLTPAAYRLLDLTSFFTAGPMESRAWTIRRGQNAREAAGKIHSDLERGFIRAETIGWRELVDAGGHAEAQKRGLVRVEGRDYVVQDGDVLNIRFNV
jgi:GTP-binding protein YchF